MSASGPEMEREYSTQSLLSRVGSERESRYRVEMGIYMSSFAATIFTAVLVTVGVSLISLLIALTVMLQTCQSKNGGVLGRQMVKVDDYEYCKILFLHLELNHVDLDAYPAVCKEFMSHYISEGQYARELNITLTLIQGYFNSINQGEDGQDVALMDADDLLSTEDYFTRHPLKRSCRFGCQDFGKDAIQLKQWSILDVYLKLRAGGWSLILLSRKPERLRSMMIEQLNSTGYGGWLSLIMRKDDEMKVNIQEYISSSSSTMQKQGYRIVAAISSQLDFLAGSSPGRRNFKLPNLIIGHKIDEGTSMITEE